MKRSLFVFLLSAIGFLALPEAPTIIDDWSKVQAPSPPELAAQGDRDSAVRQEAPGFRPSLWRAGGLQHDRGGQSDYPLVDMRDVFVRLPLWTKT
jgi:hypothetical protein